MSTVTKTTPVEDVIKSRAKLITLAKLTFDNNSPSAQRAFSQFRKNEVIAELIEAQREGIFDYGEHIVKTDSGWEYPSAEEVIEMLEAAKEDGGDEPKKKQTTKKATTRKATTRKTKAAEKKPETDSTTDNALVVDLGPVLEGQEDIFKAATCIGKGLRALVGMVENIYERQDELAAYLDPHAELPVVDEAVMEDLEALQALLGTEPEKPAAKKTAAKKQTTKKAASKPAETDETEQIVTALKELDYDDAQIDRMTEDTVNQILTEEIPAEGVSILKNGKIKILNQSKDDNGEGTAEFSDDDLNNMSFENLQELAANIGVADVEKITFKPLLKNAIKRKMQA